MTQFLFQAEGKWTVLSKKVESNFVTIPSLILLTFEFLEYTASDSGTTVSEKYMVLEAIIMD